MNMSPMFIYSMSGFGVAAMNSPVSRSRNSRPWWESWKRNVKELCCHCENLFNLLEFRSQESDHTSNLYERPIVTGLHVGRHLGTLPDNEGDGAGLYGQCAIF